MNKIMVFILSACLLVGCVSVGRKIDQSAANRIEKGKTTREQVIRLIGSPDQITIRGDDTVFLYQYMRATAKPETFIPIVGAFVGGANVQNQMIMITFSPDGKVKDVLNTRGSTEASQGLATGNKAELKGVEEGKRPK